MAAPGSDIDGPLGKRARSDCRNIVTYAGFIPETQLILLKKSALGPYKAQFRQSKQYAFVMGTSDADGIFLDTLNSKQRESG